MTRILPGEFRFMAVLTGAIMIAGLFVGLMSQQAEAKPYAEQYINPCVSPWNGRVQHGASECPAGTYEFDLSYGEQTLCVNMYNRQFRYSYGGNCSTGEYPVVVGGKFEVWGCVNTWTGGVSYIPSPASPCTGKAMPFETGFVCRYTSQAADTPVWEPQC